MVNATTKITIMNKNLCLNFMIFLPKTLVGQWITVLVPGFLE